MCSFSESFSKVCEQGSNVSLDLWCVNFIFHQNWQVRMCCVVRFWAVWTFFSFFQKKKLEHMYSELATSGEKIKLLRERCSFRNIIRWKVKRSLIMQRWIKINCVEIALSFWEIRRIFVKFENAARFEITFSSCEFRLGFQMALKILT